MFHEISSCFNDVSFKLHCFSRTFHSIFTMFTLLRRIWHVCVWSVMKVMNESEMGMERWSVFYNCRPVEASVELTSPYTGKVVKVHHKAMGKLTILNTSNLLSKITEGSPGSRKLKVQDGRVKSVLMAWLIMTPCLPEECFWKTRGQGRWRQPLTSWMTMEPSHACLDRCKTPSKSAPFSLMWRPETARRQHHHHPSHSLHQQLHHQHLQGESSNSNWLLVRHI